MRKDIEIPEVKDVHVAAVKEWDEDFLHQNWFVYLINESDRTIELTIVLSRGSDPERKTATLRHGLGTLEPKSYRKIEFLTEEILPFTNEFLVTFFAENKLYEKTFVFPPGSISENKTEEIPVMKTEGVLAD